MSGLGEEEVSKIKTLCDFVDEESIELITSKAESSMQNLKVRLLIRFSYTE